MSAESLPARVTIDDDVLGRGTNWRTLTDGEAGAYGFIPWKW
jgi:hypothetical protein